MYFGSLALNSIRVIYVHTLYSYFDKSFFPLAVLVNIVLHIKIVIVQFHIVKVFTF